MSSYEITNNNKYIGNYFLEQKLGVGAFSLVYKAKNVKTDLDVAIKIIEKATFPEKNFTRELYIMKKVVHPFCVTLYEFMEDENYYYLVMEYIEGQTLMDYLNSIQGSTPEFVSRHFFCQLISALDYLHNAVHFIHRDLKLENIMIDRNNNIRLIDFGLGNFIDPDNPLFKTNCGSASYAAPELFCNSLYTSKVDIWSAGIILYAMLCGKLPFEDINIYNLMTKIVNDPLEFPSCVTSEQKDLMSHILDKNPETRYSIEDIQSHPWFQKYYFANEMNKDFGILQEYSTLDYKLQIIQDLINKSVSQNDSEDEIRNEIISESFGHKSALYRILLREQITDNMASMYYKNKNSAMHPVSKGLTKQTGNLLTFGKRKLSLNIIPPQPPVQIKGNINPAGSFTVKRTTNSIHTYKTPIKVPIVKHHNIDSFLMTSVNNH